MLKQKEVSHVKVNSIEQKKEEHENKGEQLQQRPKKQWEEPRRGET